MIEVRELLPFSIPPGTSTPRFRSAVRYASKSLKTRLGLGAEPLEIWEEGSGWKLQADGIAGVLTFANEEIEIRPKFLSSATAVNWRASLLRLVELATRVRLGFTGRVLASLAQTSFYDHVAIAFADSVLHASESGPILLYRRIPEELPYLRGTLMVGRQFQLLHKRPGVVAQEVDELIPDNPISRLLKWAAELLRFHVRTPYARAKLDLVERVMPGIPPQLPHSSVLERLTLPPQHKNWREAFQLAQLLGRSQAVGQGLGLVPVPGIVFDTVRLFERMVSILLAHAAAKARSVGDDWWTTEKVSCNWLFPQQGGEQIRKITPDDQLRIGSTTKLLFDAKYKGRPEDRQLVPPSPSRADVQEAVVFMGATNCNRILLIYPRLESAPLPSTSVRGYSARVMGGEAFIFTTTVDLAALAQGPVSDVVEGLRLVIDQALTAMMVQPLP